MRPPRPPTPSRDTPCRSDARPHKHKPKTTHPRPPSAAILSFLGSLSLSLSLPQGTTASPLAQRTPFPSRPREPSPTPNPPPAFLAPAIALRKRAGGLPALYTPDPEADGGWILADGWILHGKSYDQRDGSPGYDPSTDDNTDGADDFGDGDDDADTNTDVIVSSTSTVTPTPTATSSAKASSTTTSLALTDLPTGWLPASPRTQLYAVPLIVVSSIVLACLIVGLIGGAVWRHKRKDRVAMNRSPSMQSGDSDDLEKMKNEMVRQMEKKLKLEEKAGRKGMRKWAHAGEKWQARLALRKRGKRRRKEEQERADKEAAGSQAPEEESIGESTALAGPPTPPRSSTPILPPIQPPAYPSSAPPSPTLEGPSTPTPRVYPFLPDPPPTLRQLVVPVRAHIATDDKRVLGRMARAGSAPLNALSPDAAPEGDDSEPTVPDWEDEQLPPQPTSHPEPELSTPLSTPPSSPSPVPPPPPPPPPLPSFSSLPPAHPQSQSQSQPLYSGEEHDAWAEFGGASAPAMEDLEWPVYEEHEGGTAPEEEEEEEVSLDASSAENASHFSV